MFPPLEELNRFSPKLCRAMAFTKGKLLTQRELVSRSGLSKERLFDLSTLDKWDGVPIGEAFRYARACGLELQRLRSTIYWRMRCSRTMFKTANAKQRKLLARLLPN